MSFTEAQRTELAGIMGQTGHARRGLVTSYQATPPMAKVTLQPEDIELGWLPVLSQWVGNGWGIVAPLQVDDQVALIAEEGDGQNFAIIGRYFSDVDAPPATAVAAGEFLIQHASGARLHFMADGSVSIMTAVLNIAAPGGGAAQVNITGALDVSGDVTAADVVTGTVPSLNSHTHMYRPGTGTFTTTSAPEG
jgi:phage baseplate assembly protein gpV